ncbi:Pleckstrin homology-like domain family B member 3,Pleckstrin homology-like domain family B member 2,Pleckstrin homology-like domain family B member 1 [Lepeophtheirus salmonis]|uniref:Pleckstrin homology-like domain family B member 3,Pleckstrin homology-like domain family B member 2,Pleckstrin homology-like domain family B member 1 n=1 Tax=Lepeophtheirus salmonis TaxID=72036 RepID=A0A7R8D4P1_LEPSM|nr:Pleckstrin homology-like domain family B member 3,Pleckstrin homology-like domain family B member 2,Pleckstrin homology-like domain family B member 1 [Lepeophtheirus salmonis]CAF2996490.1 Pleckstrin homology-like domain family B member 3,Pleckstrin homology-like domain family B member 2,Pleckstrin homology-like domain family B member 1 [Lepeophtheirus salmonis]
MKESNRILRNSLGKMEPSERIKLEEILDMCIEYERQIESQMESKGNGVDPNRTPSSSNGGYASLMPLHSPNGSLQTKGIKTNGSLPREKRQVSPNTEPENIIFNFEGLAQVNEESFLIPPSSPRTRIRTYLGSNNGTSSSSRFSSPPPVVNEPRSPLEGGITNEDASSSSPSSTVCRKPPRSKHDQGPSSPIKDCEDQFQPLPSEEASSRMLIGTTMLNHKLTGNSILRNGLSPVASSSPPGSKTPLQEFNKSYKIVDTLKSQRHAQILLLSAVKRQLSDLESEAAEGLKELELERSLILGEREAEASKLDKLKLRCNQLKTQEARLSGVFQELQKSLSRKTDSAKHKIIEAEDEIKRLEGLLSKKETEEEEHYILMHLKEQYEILDNETKAFEDLEFHQMEEETSKETEREELLKEISDVEALVNEKLKKLEEIDFQPQRQKLLCDLDREKIKLSSIERKLSSYFLSDKEQLVMDDGDYYEEARGMEEDHRHTIVSTSSMEEEEEENGILHTNGNSCESGKISSESISEHSTTVEYSEDEGIRVSVSSSYQESNERLRKSGSNQHKIVSYNTTMDGGEYCSHSSSESTKSSSLSTNKNSSSFKDSSRPLSDESSYWDENDPSSIEVKRRGGRGGSGNKTQQRPLTRYLPIRNEAFDLRVHIESAGHPLDSNPAVSRHILLNSSSCRGHLYKMSSKFRKWNRRWFVFDRNKRTLIYYSDKTETKAKGGIYFESIEDVYVDHLNSLKSHKPKETFLMKTRDRLYCLMAPTIETMRIWIDVIFTGAEGSMANLEEASKEEEEDGEEREDNYSKYLIIGGGISGLAAANELIKQGCISGETKTELGANWIHGVLGNPLYELAASNGLVDLTPEPPRAHNVAATTEDGRRLPFSILQETYEAYFWFFKRCEEYFLCKYQPPEGVKSVGDHIELEISIYLQKFPQQQRHLRRLVFDYLLQRECCITGCNNMKEVDLISIGSYTELPGGNITIPHGYSSLLSPIIKIIPPSCILKAHPVNDCSVKTVKSAKKIEDIEVASCPSGLSTANATAESSIQSSNAKTEKCFYADHVICTIPLGVLRHPSSVDLFQPTLPPDKRASFQKNGLWSSE